MATTLEIIRGISQAAANAYDGALDEDGKPLEMGLRREEGHPILDSRVMDGFGVKFHGNLLKITYQSDIKLKEVYGGGFENDIANMINAVASFLKREYKKITGNTLTLTKTGDPDIIVQETSRVRTWVQANCDYKIGGIDDVEPVEEASEEKLDKAIKNWLGSNGNLKRVPGGFGKDAHTGAKKPQNVTGKRDLEPRS
tara:strand:+ start:815 stop:1408 length:594 start_codon:yes stop_codon:yes gene_type:complete